MPPPDNPIKCTFCTQTFSTTGNLNTHFRDFLPELPAFLTRSGPPRGSTYHPPCILREHLRTHSLAAWRDQLAPKDASKARARVLRAFAAHAWSNGHPHRAAWRDRRVDAVSRVRWGRMVTAVCEAYPDAQDKTGMADAVRDLVADAIRRTFVGVEEPPEEDEEEPPARPGKRHRGSKPASAAAVPVLSKRQREKQPDDEEAEREPSPGTNHLGASFNAAVVHGRARDVGVNKSSTNYGVKVAVSVPSASATASVTDEFFPLLVLSLAVFRTTELVPAEIYTTWEEVKEVIARLLGEPEFCVVLMGCAGDRWDGVWDEDVWEDVKREADRTAEPVVFRVRLKLG